MRCYLKYLKDGSIRNAWATEDLAVSALVARNLDSNRLDRSVPYHCNVCDMWHIQYLEGGEPVAIQSRQ